MTGFEVNFVVPDVLAAFETSCKVFGVEAVEKTAFGTGSNEVVFTLFHNHRFHMLDENPAYGLVAPKEGQGGFIRFNLVVEDSKEVFDKAEVAGFTTVQPIQELPDFGVKNSMQKDPWGYGWMLHQVDRVVGFEERVKLIEAPIPQK
jgi:PhnB protein